MSSSSEKIASLNRPSSTSSANPTSSKRAKFAREVTWQIGSALPALQASALDCGRCRNRGACQGFAALPICVRSDQSGWRRRRNCRRWIRSGFRRGGRSGLRFANSPLEAESPRDQIKRAALQSAGHTSPPSGTDCDAGLHMRGLPKCRTRTPCWRARPRLAPLRLRWRAKTKLRATATPRAELSEIMRPALRGLR